MTAAQRDAWPATAKALKRAMETFGRIDGEYGDQTQDASETLGKVWGHVHEALAEIDRIAKEVVGE